MSGIRNERGIALLTVITALVALMIIAVPFGIAMWMGYERSIANNARTRAQTQVDSAMEFLKAYRVRSTELVEEENRAAERKDCNNNDPDCDTLAELEPTIDQIATALGIPVEQLRDPYGTILGFDVEDENGKINLNDASYFAIGNLLGLSFLTGDLTEQNRTIDLEDAASFPERGYVKVGRELILLMKNFPHTTTVGRYYPEGVSLVIDEQSRGSLSGFEWVDDITRLEPGLNEIDFCGVPIAWISGRLLRAIEPPWFGTQWDGGECTHDVFFAKKVQAAGFKIYVDADMPCGHTTLPGVVTFENRTVTRAWVKTLTPEERQAMR